MKNIIHIYREAFRLFPGMKWQLPLRAVLTVVIPLIESAIPAMAIAMILEKNIRRYITGISLLLIFDVVVRIVKNLLDNCCQNYTVGVGTLHFWPVYLKKCLTMDYCNVEPADLQDKIQKGRVALNGDMLGIKGLMSYSFSLVCCSVGLLSYGAVVTTVDIRILFIIIAMGVSAFFFHRHAIQYADDHARERDQANRAVDKMTWEARQPKYGKDIRIYHMEHWFSERFTTYFHRLLKWHGKMELRWFFPTISSEAFGIVRDLLMYSVLIAQVIHGSMTVAEFTFYIGIVSGFCEWLNQFMFQVSGVLRTNTESRAYFEEMDMPDVFLHGEGEKLDLTAPVSIEFRDVSFGYGENKEILSHLSFRIEKGQKIALVGSNGAGKTTIVKLLCGFYLPTDGEVLINGIPTSQYDIEDYRKGISAVFQDGYISAFSVAENVAGGEAEKIDYERVRESLRQVGLWGKISGLPAQENSYISQQLEKSGVDFSGGEQQKLLIARAYYQNGKLLVLDEPTSALDPIAESKIYEQYYGMTQDKTALFISHRLASTKFCDEILYLEKGKVKERGSHEELLKRQGAYARMFDIQSQYYKEEEGL